MNIGMIEVDKLTATLALTDGLRHHNRLIWETMGKPRGYGDRRALLVVNCHSIQMLPVAEALDYAL